MIVPPSRLLGLKLLEYLFIATFGQQFDEKVESRCFCPLPVLNRVKLFHILRLYYFLHIEHPICICQIT